MAKSKPSPYQAFTNNMADAEMLLSYALAFENQRTRRMRRELRERIGDALKIPNKQRERLDCIESDDVFVVFTPGGKLARGDFQDLRPLLRQSLVAACAALETYVADKAMTFVGSALKADERPRRMENIPFSVGQWGAIEREYERRQWGIRGVVEGHLRETSSTAPNRIAEVLSTIGLIGWVKSVDKARQVKSGTTETQLKKLTERRNRIAHSADRQGRSRASLAADEVRGHIDTVKSVVDATEALLKDHRV